MAAKKRTKVATVEEIEEVEPEAVEDTAGAPVEMALILTTTGALVAGIIAGLYELGAHFATGPFAG